MILKDSIKAENLHEIDQPFESRFGTAYSLDRIEDKRLISPFCNLIITENPFKKEVRTYPIDMVYRHSRSYSAIVHVPNGYKILSLPENMDIDNNEVRIQYQAENTNDGTIKITGIYQFKKDVYDPSSFTELKGYFNKIIDKFNEKVVFSKVNP
jgi:hypothetical protein